MMNCTFSIQSIADRSGKTVTSPFFHKYISGRTNSEWIPVLFENISAERAGAKVIGITGTHNASELDSCDLLVKDFKSLSIEQLEQLFGEN